MRLHLVGFPHTETTSEFVTCAYTSKVVKAGAMFTRLGYDVIVYSGEENEAECSEHVTCFTRGEREGWYGAHDQGSLWGHAKFDEAEPPWQAFNARVGASIAQRLTGDDLVLILAGLAQRPLAAALPTAKVIEWGVGYEGVFANFIAFESHAWRHYVYGKYGPAMLGVDCAGRFYDDVIPNFFDVDQFRVGAKGDYLLFLGRVIKNKGPEIAVAIAERLGMKLVIAGPGAYQPATGQHRDKVIGDGVELAGGEIEYVGPVDVEARAELLSGARALLAPTLYLEPFGGVAVEAMLSGTPAVTTNWGAFPETVQEGVTGYRFNRVAEGVRATEAAMKLDAAQIRAAAEARYSTLAVGRLYDRWFERLHGLNAGNDFFGLDAPPPLIQPARASRRKVPTPAARPAARRARA